MLSEPTNNPFHRGPLPGIYLHPLKSKSIFQKSAYHHLRECFSTYFPILTSGPQAPRPGERKGLSKLTSGCAFISSQQQLCSKIMQYKSLFRKKVTFFLKDTESLVMQLCFRRGQLCTLLFRDN